MITLDGITLNPDMIWRERFVSQNLAQSVRRTVGGIAVIFSGGLTKGEPITLSATEMNGMLIGVLRKSVVDQLLALVIPGSIYVLNFGGVNYSVVFRPPGVDMVPIVARASYGPTDLMRGDINLLRV